MKPFWIGYMLGLGFIFGVIFMVAVVMGSFKLSPRDMLPGTLAAGATLLLLLFIVIGIDASRH